MDQNVTIDHQTIEKVKLTKYLGIFIDDQLKWNDLIYYVKTKISKSLAIIYKIRK